MPAKLSDNAFIDEKSYGKSLNRLDPLTRKQLLDGNWTVNAAGMFRRDWFVDGKSRVLASPQDVPQYAPKVRVWDFATTAEGEASDPDYTSGLLAALVSGQMFILDVRRFRGSPKQIEDSVKMCAELDGREVPVHIEQEKGSAGKNLVDQYSRNVLLGCMVVAESPAGDKEVRAAPLANAAERGNIKLVRGTWNTAFLDEIEAFPFGAHKDHVDCAAYAYNALCNRARKPIAR